MAIEVDANGRPKPRDGSDVPARDPAKAAQMRERRVAKLREKAESAGIVATEPSEAFAAGDHALSRLEVDDKTLDMAEEWYLKGLTKPRELAALLKQDVRYTAETLIPAVLRRLARGRTGDERRAAAGEAVGRYRLLLKYAWNELHRAGKPSVKAQWAQVVMNANREIDKLHGVAGTEVDTKVLLGAVNAFAERVVEIVEATNDPALMHRIEGALGQLLRSKDLPVGVPEPVDAEFTEVAEPSE